MKPTVCLLVLDEPMIGHYGGDLAGPVFRRVAQASLRYLGVTPNEGSKKLEVSRADDPADKLLAAFQKPQADSAPAPATTAPVTDGIPVPDVGGMGARDAVRAMLGAGLLPQVDGSGRAVRQAPAAGATVPKGTTVRVSFESAS